jgi:1-deoxy-D-xylulose-5-phosphate reductoisomerase
MRLPIGYALAYPDRLPPIGSADLSALEAIGAKPDAATLLYNFEAPDCERFPCIRLAFEALERGGTAPAVLSAANEVAVGAFIEGRMRFGEIPRLIERVMNEVEAGELTLDGVREADRAARERAERIVGKVATS